MLARQAKQPEAVIQRLEAAIAEAAQRESRGQQPATSFAAVSALLRPAPAAVRDLPQQQQAFYMLPQRPPPLPPAPAVPAVPRRAVADAASLPVYGQSQPLFAGHPAPVPAALLSVVLPQHQQQELAQSLHQQRPQQQPPQQEQEPAQQQQLWQPTPPMGALYTPLPAGRLPSPAYQPAETRHGSDAALYLPQAPLDMAAHQQPLRQNAGRAASMPEASVLRPSYQAAGVPLVPALSVPDCSGSLYPVVRAARLKPLAAADALPMAFMAQGSRV
jgi:hypothetical protein